MLARASYLALCILANGCSLEVPGTGLGVDALDASIAASETGGSSNQEDDRKEMADAAWEEAPQADGGLPPVSDQPDATAIAPVIDGAVAPEPGAVAPEPGCVLDGRFALRVVLDVAWIGTEFASIVPIIDNGEGELSFTVLMDLKSNHDTLQAKFRTCASEVPEFVAALSREHYQARFADRTWDAASMPTFSLSLRTACREPGCSVGGGALHALIGASLPSPTAPWPLDAAAGSWPDHDGDGQPGIAISMLGPERGDFAYPPLDLLSLRRVRDLSLGLRVIVGLDGKLDSCDALHGPTREASVETRAASCQALTSPTACQPSELRFLNENLPVWTVRQGSFQAKRLTLDSDCQAVRRLFERRATP